METKTNQVPYDNKQLNKQDKPKTNACTKIASEYVLLMQYLIFSIFAPL